MESNPKDTLSTGHKIRISAMLDNVYRQKIRQLTKKINLPVIEEQIQIIVYKPKPNHAGNLILK
jgi:hypothetical protein